MTLKEKFLPRMYCFFGSGMLTNSYDEKVAEDNAKQCEDIVDEFAVEFGEWLLSRATGEEGLKLRDDILEIFKKEKGL
jgi:hypothetical protein